MIKFYYIANVCIIYTGYLTLVLRFFFFYFAMTHSYIIHITWKVLLSIKLLTSDICSITYPSFEVLFSYLFASVCSNPKTWLALDRVSFVRLDNRDNEITGTGDRVIENAGNQDTQWPWKWNAAGQVWLDIWGC